MGISLGKVILVSSSMLVSRSSAEWADQGSGRSSRRYPHDRNDGRRESAYMPMMYRDRKGYGVRSRRGHYEAARMNPAGSRTIASQYRGYQQPQHITQLTLGEIDATIETVVNRICNIQSKMPDFGSDSDMRIKNVFDENFEALYDRYAAAPNPDKAARDRLRDIAEKVWSNQFDFGEVFDAETNIIRVLQVQLPGWHGFSQSAKFADAGDRLTDLLIMVRLQNRLGNFLDKYLQLCPLGQPCSEQLQIDAKGCWSGVGSLGVEWAKYDQLT